MCFRRGGAHPGLGAENTIMEYINRIELRGTVGSVRAMSSTDQRQGLHVSLATQYAYHGRGGEANIDTEWHSVNIWEGKNIPPEVWHIQKGDKLHLIGRIKSQKYTGSDGVERSSYDVLPIKIQVVSSDENLQIEMN